MTIIKVGNLIFMLLCAALMVGIGVLQWRSREPVSFWSRRNPPKKDEIKDITVYNRLHGALWGLFGGVLVISLIANFFTGKAHTGYTILIGSVLMLVFHKLIEKLDRRK